MTEGTLIRKSIEFDPDLYRQIKVAVAGTDGDTIRDFIDRATRAELERMSTHEASAS